MHVIRRFLLACTVLLISLCLLEGISYAVYYFTQGSFFDYKEIIRQQKPFLSVHRKAAFKDLFEDAPKSEDALDYMLHPYLGYTWNYALTNHRNLDLPPSQHINQYGFLEFEGTNFLDNSAGTANIVLTGGSVAQHASMMASQVLLERLGKLPVFQNRKLQLITLAIYGYKQPQQLLSVIYYLTLGGKIDLLINLDGYNEVALPTMTLADGVSPYYPKAWPYLGIRSISMDLLNGVHNIYRLRQWQADLADIAHTLPYSATVGTLWTLANQGITKAIITAHVQLGRHGVNKAAPINGPIFPNQGDYLQKIDQMNLHVWKTSSMEMQAVAASVNALYFHFLQPNQYVAGSKTFTEKEKLVAVGIAPQQVLNGYANLRAEIPLMRKTGMHIYDLTGIYKNVHEDIYFDTCCHVNEKGNEIIMNNIADAIADYYQ